MEREPMKGYNFRFSDKQISDLDAVVHEWNADPYHFPFFGRATRTDVLKQLVMRELSKIEEIARKALEIPPTNGKPQTKKGKAKPCKTSKPSAPSKSAVRKSSKPSTR